MTVIDRIMTPQNVHLLVPGFHEYVGLHGKEKLSLLVNSLWVGEVILNYPDGPSVITGIFINRKEGSRGVSHREVWRCYAHGFVLGGTGLQAKECTWPPEAGKGEGMNSQDPLKGTWTPCLLTQWDPFVDFCKMRYLCCFKPVGLWLICCSNKRKGIQWVN